MLNGELKFFDFCAGIGGGRLGLERCGLKCVGHSEIDKDTEQTYKVFYGKQEKNYGDLMKIDTAALPDFDLMIGGFPCQTFSTIGKRAGFDDERGQVIFGLMKILKEKNVKYFILENVKGFVSHDNGNSLKTVLTEFDKLGYDVSWKVLNSINFGVPQSRERIYLVGIRKDIPHKAIEWQTACNDTGLTLKDCLKGLHGEPIDIYHSKGWQNYLNNDINKGKFTEKDLLKKNYLVIDHRNRELRTYTGKTPTLRKGNSDLFYAYKNQMFRVNGYQGLMLQGFPKEYITKAKRAKLKPNKLLGQAGNAMTVNVVTSVCNALLKSVATTEKIKEIKTESTYNLPHNNKLCA